jgi:hypothetical protein
VLAGGDPGRRSVGSVVDALLSHRETKASGGAGSPPSAAAR